jgi:hypothetical protein
LCDSDNEKKNIIKMRILFIFRLKAQARTHLQYTAEAREKFVLLNAVFLAWQQLRLINARASIPQTSTGKQNDCDKNERESEQISVLN